VVSISGRHGQIAVLGVTSLFLLGSIGPKTARVQKRPVLTVGTDRTPPYYQQGPDGRITGVAVDVLTRAAAKLDFDLRFVSLTGKPDDFLRSRSVDLWPLLTITPERIAAFHVTPPWLYNTLCLFRLSGSTLPKGSSLRLAHSHNNFTSNHAKLSFPLAQLLPKSSREAILLAVCSGSADAGIIETRVLDSLLLERPHGCETARLARQMIPGASSPLGIASIKSVADRADQLHDEITNMANSGELAGIFERWSGVSANEASSIVAMNAAQQRTRFAYVGIVVILTAAAVVLWQFRRVRKAFRLANREMTERKRAEEARNDSDRTRNLVLEGAGEGICGLDAEGRTTFLNSAAARLLGLDPTCRESQDFHNLVHGAGLSGCPGLDCPFYGDRQSRRELRVHTAEFFRTDGSRFFVEFTDSPLMADGVYNGSVVTFKDITSRRQDEALDHDRNTILEMLAENESLQSIFEAIASLVERQCPGLFCSIMTVSGGQLELQAAPQLPDTMRHRLRALEIGPCSLPCGTAAHWSKPVIVSDISTDLLWERDRSAALESGIASCWSYPILSASGDVLGTIALYGPVPGNPAIAHQVLLQVACRLSGLAIEQTRLTQQLHHQAHHDSLTGLPNRLMFEERLRQALSAARRNRTLCAVFYIDLDRFKQINDTLTHRVGDLYLCQISKRLETVLPTAATLARLGGDEFAVLIPSVENEEEAGQLGRAFLEAMARPFSVEGYTLFGTASIGIGLSSAQITASELQSCADQAMYRAKSLGRNQFRYYSADMSSRAIAALEMEHSLREALEHDRFSLYYQPQCRANGDLIGFEALIRLRHPERGMIPPNDFIPVAEDTGLILPIGSWVLRESCRQLATWHAEGFPAVTIAINVSAAQLAQSNFAAEVATALNEHALHPSALEIELTESMIMSNFDECLSQMNRLRELGVKLSIDDFGTGYSSLSYLHRLPVHTIKIDQSFVRAMDAEVSTRPLVEAICAAARSLQYNVIAEGVETEAQRRELARIGCDHMQGYLFSRPMPAAEVIKQFELQSTNAMPLAS